MLAGAVPLGAFVDGAQSVAVVALSLASIVQPFLFLAYANRRVEVEYLWPLEQRLRFGEKKGATYRAEARHVSVELDDLRVNARDVRDVQVRTVFKPNHAERTTEVFLVFDHRVILVESSDDHATLAEYAVELRKRFGVEGGKRGSQSISPAPTQQLGCQAATVALGVGGLAAVACFELAPRFGHLIVMATVALLVTVLCVVLFFVTRAMLRTASRRWIFKEFGVDPEPAQRGGQAAAR